MNRNDNIFVAIILTFLLIAIFITEHTAKAASPNASVWATEITQPIAERLVEVAPTPTPTPTPTPIGVQAVEITKSYLGTPYVWGGTTPKGFDCSGLVQYAYKQAGVDISRTTYTQVKEGRQVAKDELKVGDLVFFAIANDVHHVGIYIGEGQFIHAPQTGEVVKITNLSDRKDYYMARRFVE